MLEADLRNSVQDANDIIHFFLIMEHKGYKIKCPPVQIPSACPKKVYRFIVIPGRKDPLFTGDDIRDTIGGELDEIAAGNRPAIIYRTH